MGVTYKNCGDQTLLRYLDYRRPFGFIVIVLNGIQHFFAIFAIKLVVRCIIGRTNVAFTPTSRQNQRRVDSSRRVASRQNQRRVAAEPTSRRRPLDYRQNQRRVWIIGRTNVRHLLRRWINIAFATSRAYLERINFGWKSLARTALPLRMMVGVWHSE